jgi:hypothetical protein
MAGQKSITATIANGESVSGEIMIPDDIRYLAILMPAAWTAANLTFEASEETGGTFRDVYTDAGDEVTVSAAVSRAISIDLNSSALAPYQYLKIRSGTTAVPVAQGAARELIIVLKR